MIITHSLAASELAALPDRLRGHTFRLIELLEEGRRNLPFCKTITGGFFELQAGSRGSLYCYEAGNVIFLLHACAKETAATTATAINLARKRLEGLSETG